MCGKVILIDQDITPIFNPYVSTLEIVRGKNERSERYEICEECSDKILKQIREIRNEN